jgi:hypothetical protein
LIRSGVAYAVAICLRGQLLDHPQLRALKPLGAREGEHGVSFGLDVFGESRRRYHGYPWGECDCGGAGLALVSAEVTGE